METRRPHEERQLLDHIASSSSSLHTISDDATSEYELEEEPTHHEEPKQSRIRSRGWPLSWRSTPRRKIASAAAYFYMAPGRRRRGWAVRAVQFLMLLPYMVAILVLVAGVFFPSYALPPRRYLALRIRIEESSELGRGNPNNEKVFVVTSLYDKNGELLGGAWGDKLKELVDILGPSNVHLSIYENDPDELARLALMDFGSLITSNKSLVSEHLDLAGLPHVTTFRGDSRLKRIAFLAEVRNRALLPLTDLTSTVSTTRFDKLLYINDVFFNPADVANLLFSTSVDDTTNRTDYRAACAVDFINPFKFYDTFATRDAEGYQMGVPFFPWFTASGSGTSRNDVLAQKDAVRVKSCWGGMVAFEAKWFQPHLHSIAQKSSPVDDGAALRFRAETDTYWDASECCLIHADLAELSSSTSSLSTDPFPAAIYMNPYVRVAYSPSTLAWLPFTARFERLYPWIHRLVNLISARPGFNPRREQIAGETVLDTVWTGERFESVERVATAGQFCGGRLLEYLHEAGDGGEDEGKWGFEKVPAEAWGT